MTVKTAFQGFGVVALLAAGAPAAADATYTLLSVKGNPTMAAGINDAGDITGSFATGHGKHFSVRGFVRSARGRESKFLMTDAAATQPAAMNDMGQVAGRYSLRGSSSHGFIRNPNKDIVEFDPDKNDVTLPVAINPSGASLAILWKGTSEKGAIRSAGGTMTEFQAPKSGGERPATVPTAFNADGEATGYDTTISDQHSRGFVRSPDGTVTMFDAPGAGGGNSQGTFPMAVNSDGTIAGYDLDAEGAAHGFLRTADGTMTSFDVAGGSGAVVTGMNDAGAIVGVYFVGTDGHAHGFVRAPDGTITTVDVPGASETRPVGINSSGQIVGTSYDGRMSYAFIRTP